MENGESTVAALKDVLEDEGPADLLQSVQDYCQGRLFTFKDASDILKITPERVGSLVDQGAIRGFTIPRAFTKGNKLARHPLIMGENLFAYIQAQKLGKQVELPSKILHAENAALPQLTDSTTVTVEDIAKVTGASKRRAEALVRSGFMPRHTLGIDGKALVSARIFVRFLFLGLRWNADEIEQRTGWNRADIGVKLSLALSEEEREPKKKTGYRPSGDRRKAQ